VLWLREIARLVRDNADQPPFATGNATLPSDPPSPRDAPDHVTAVFRQRRGQANVGLIDQCAASRATHRPVEDASFFERRAVMTRNRLSCSTAMEFSFSISGLNERSESKIIRSAANWRVFFRAFRVPTRPTRRSRPICYIVFSLPECPVS
jgi:hypothetical protein